MMTLCEIFHSTFSSLDGHLQAENYQSFGLSFFFSSNLSRLDRFLSAFRVVVYAHVVNFLLNFYSWNQSHTNHYVLLIFLLWRLVIIQISNLGRLWLTWHFNFGWVSCSDWITRGCRSKCFYCYCTPSDVAAAGLVFELHEADSKHSKVEYWAGSNEQTAGCFFRCCSPCKAEATHKCRLRTWKRQRTL